MVKIVMFYLFDM